MSAGEPVVCRGAPRDLGLDQGSALPEPIRRAALRVQPRRRLAWRAREADPRSARVRLDVVRHFPHDAERIEGLARGSGVSPEALFALLARESGGADGFARAAGEAALFAVLPERSGGGALLARSLERPVDAVAGFRVRESAPEHDHRALEVVTPWLAAPVAGVNERGLAAAVTALAPDGTELAACAAPAALLVGDCLQRFDCVASALEWCERRPAGGNALVVLADAAGDVAGVRVRGSERRVLRPHDGLLVGLAAPTREVALAQAADRDRLDAAGLVEALGSHGGRAGGDDESPCRHGRGRETAGLVLLDPVARALWLLADPPCRTSFADARRYALPL